MNKRQMLVCLAIVAAVLAMFGTVLVLRLTGTSLNVVSFLGAIIGVGIVTKNVILMLDFVKVLRAEKFTLEEALVQSGRRRLRPVLMTSMTTIIGIAYAGLRYRFRGRYAEAPGYCCYRSSFHLGLVFSHSHPNGLFHPLEPLQQNKRLMEHIFHTCL